MEFAPEELRETKRCNPPRPTKLWPEVSREFDHLAKWTKKGPMGSPLGCFGGRAFRPQDTAKLVGDGGGSSCCAGWSKLEVDGVFGGACLVEVGERFGCPSN